MCTPAIQLYVVSNNISSELTFNGHVKTAQQRTIIAHSYTVIGTMAVDGWAVTFGTARRGLGGLRPRPVS